jgi:hypothetical protein
MENRAECSHRLPERQTTVFGGHVLIRAELEVEMCIAGGISIGELGISIGELGTIGSSSLCE